MSTAVCTITKVDTLLPTTNAPFASTLVKLTDSNGVEQSVSLTAAPWVATFQNVAAVAGATGTVTAQDLDTAGAAIGAVVSQTFSEIGSPVMFPASTSISVAIS